MLNLVEHKETTDLQRDITAFHLFLISRAVRIAAACTKYIEMHTHLLKI